MIKKQHYIQHKELQHEGYTHGFFTRNGGVSQGVYASLNVAYGSKDHPEAVEENRTRIAHTLGASVDRLYTLSQIHSNKVVVISSADDSNHRAEADALVSNEKDVLLGILTADCVPVLFIDPTNHVIAAAHAGWKGAIGGIIENTIESMQSIGAETRQIRAVIGPSIHQNSYEVDQHYYQQFIEHASDYQQFFIPSPTADRYLFDLPRFVLHQLERAAIQHIGWVEQDTYSNETEFFSYRRTTHRQEADFGRQISVIGIKKPQS